MHSFTTPTVPFGQRLPAPLQLGLQLKPPTSPRTERPDLDICYGIESHVQEMTARQLRALRVNDLVWVKQVIPPPRHSSGWAYYLWTPHQVTKTKFLGAQKMEIHFQVGDKTTIVIANLKRDANRSIGRVLDLPALARFVAEKIPTFGSADS